MKRKKGQGNVSHRVTTSILCETIGEDRLGTRDWDSDLGGHCAVWAWSRLAIDGRQEARARI